MEDGKVMNNLNVLYEDNHVIVVEKPINMLSQSDSTGDIDLLTLVKKYVKVKYNKPGNVYIGLLHRLDRPVGGVMVFARSSKSASRLCNDIKNHVNFDKTYLAVVSGIIDIDSGKFIDNLYKLENGNTIISDKGKKSVLYYEVIDRNIEKNMSLVRIKLETGRHHQIRVQFASRGYPLCGDQRYGKKDNTQLALFAYKLAFLHPVLKTKMEFCVLPPKKGYWTFFTM